jgi:hypothetical protein
MARLGRGRPCEHRHRSDHAGHGQDLGAAHPLAEHANAEEEQQHQAERKRGLHKRQGSQPQSKQVEGPAGQRQAAGSEPAFAAHQARQQ